MLNLAVLSGRLSSTPETRSFASGSRLTTLQVRIEEPGVETRSVPVAVWDPPASLDRLAADDPVVVVGRVHRRFFRTRDGRTASSVEVVADTVLRGGPRGRRLETLVERAHRRIDELVES